jgi:hypothetical protein
MGNGSFSIRGNGKIWPEQISSNCPVFFLAESVGRVLLRALFIIACRIGDGVSADTSRPRHGLARLIQYNWHPLRNTRSSVASRGCPYGGRSVAVISAGYSNSSGDNVIERQRSSPFPEPP